jgi:hypothetical protein
MAALGAAAVVAAAVAEAGEGDAEGDGAGAAVRAAKSVGFHQTTRKATARPTTTALSKKITRTRIFGN